MKITYYGHSCFYIESKEGSFVLDPYSNDTVPGYKPLSFKANIVLCSHEHSDHNGREVVELMDCCNCMKIEGIETYHDDKQGSLRGENTIHLLYLEDMLVVHLGDLGCDLTDEQLAKIKNCDVLMIPVGGHYTIDSNQASSLINRINPRVTIPMHYRLNKLGYNEISTLDKFKELYPGAKQYDTNTIEVTKDTIQQVAILKYL